MDLSAHNVVEHRPCTLVGDHQRVDFGITLEQLDREMARRAEARGREGELVRRLAHQREEFLQIARRQAGSGRNQQRPRGEKRDRREILHGVVGNLAVEERRDDVDRGGEH